MSEISLSGITGLSDLAARALLEQLGPNELPTDRKNWLSTLVGVFKEPMLALLLATAIIYIVIGDTIEAWLLFASALLIIGINVVQDIRSERALAALKDLSSPRALVIRNGERVRIDSRDLVPGDLMLVDQGDRIAADAEMLQSQNLMVNESQLTGESLPITKQEGKDAHVFSGSLVVDGTALVRVVATGSQTELGKIGVALSTIDQARTPLEQQTSKLVRRFALIGLGLSVLVGLVLYLQRGQLVEGILIGLALAMSLLPEEIPVVLTTFLALGARRLSSFGILIRKMSAVEALGTTTVLCVDKTGTLTKNEIELLELYTPPVGSAQLSDTLSASAIHLLETAALSSRAMSFDPIDMAVHKVAHARNVPTSHGELHLQLPITHDVPVLTQVWRHHTHFEIAMKGAPEVVLGLSNVSAEMRKAAQHALSEFTRRGLRVLGVARATVDELPPLHKNYPMEFAGLLAFADPIREGIPEAMQQCYDAGIRVIMITGDHPDTAQAIARQAGIRNAEEVMLGSFLSESPSVAAIAATNVFARVVPMQKLAIVRSLQAAGHVVLMTGDGVNDAPALRAANIGVAMGRRGTDVAREAASVVLTQDDFGSLVTAIRLGRRSYDNIKKAMYYIVAMHVPIAGLAMLPIVLGQPLILLPLHIVLLELLLDPMSTLVFESEREEEGVMSKPPRNPGEPIFRGRGLTIAFLQGASMLAVCASIYIWVAQRDPIEARTLTFITLMISNVVLALVDRSWTKVSWQTMKDPNRMLWVVVLFATALLLVITQVPAVAKLFGFSAFHLHDWAICGGAAAFSLSWFEVLKMFRRKNLAMQ